jgi:hypothetical protein
LTPIENYQGPLGAVWIVSYKTSPTQRTKHRLLRKNYIDFMATSPKEKKEP